MARLFVVMEELASDTTHEREQWILGIYLSRHSALKFVNEHSVGGRQLYIVDAPVVDKNGEVGMDKYLGLQRHLSKTERRLGKARDDLRLANLRLQIYRDHFDDDTGDVDLDNIAMADPVYQASWAEPDHEDD